MSQEMNDCRHKRCNLAHLVLSAATTIGTFCEYRYIYMTSVMNIVALERQMMLVLRALVTNLRGDT